MFWILPFPTAWVFSVTTYTRWAQGDLQYNPLSRIALCYNTLILFQMDWLPFTPRSKHSITEPRPPADAQTTGLNVIFSWSSLCHKGSSNPVQCLINAIRRRVCLTREELTYMSRRCPRHLRDKHFFFFWDVAVGCMSQRQSYKYMVLE